MTEQKKDQPKLMQIYSSNLEQIKAIKKDKDLKDYNAVISILLNSWRQKESQKNAEVNK